MPARMTHLRTSPAVGLQWVKAEIDTSLTRARGLIELHLEVPDNVQALQQAIIELHLVNGSAGVVQCYGVVALTEEMIQVLQALAQGRIKEREAAFTALLGSTVQLSDYLDILASGRGDCALALLPLINELRVTQGRGVRAEADLIAAEMLFLGVKAEPPALHLADGAVLATARRLLPIFQTSLLRWLKENDTAALLRVGKIAAQIANESSTVGVHEQWRAAAACAEALLLRALEDSQDLRRLFGRALQQLKLLAESGEDSAAEHGGDLVYHFVFHLARSKGASPRTQSIRQDYEVARHVPSAEAVEEFRRRIRGPNTLLLNRLAREIRQDLAEVKDRIDLVVRTGQRDEAEFDAIAVGLTRVANTLNVLGLANEQHVITNQARRLQSLRAAPAGASGEGQWMDIAVALLRVEQGLDTALFRQLRNMPDAGGRDLDEQAPLRADVRESVVALVREATVELARLKTAVDGFARSGNAAGLPDAARALGQVASSLRLLEDARAADLTGQLLDAMSGPAFAELCRQPEWIGRFAEAVALVEVHLEALRDQRADAGAILEQLSQRIAGLRQPAAPEPFVTEEPAAGAAPSTPATTAVDDEIRDIFLEEAGEVRTLLEARLGAFRRDPQERETLTEMRRAFHTLKGSGRMVGALQIGEFAWAVENMLNRCLDGSIPVGQPVVDVVVDAVARLAPLLAAFRAGQPAPEAAALIDRAQRLAAGKLLDAEAESELLAVFREDAHERLAEIRTWMERQDAGAPDFEIDETTRRALHTLRGSAAIVNLQPVSQLAGSLESYLDSLRSAHLRLTPAGFSLLRDAADAIENWVDVPEAAAAASVASWQARIHEIQAQVPEKAQQEVADKGLAEVFASEALDLLQNIESTTRDWARAPENRTSPRTIKGLYQTLYGAALMADCGAIANTARAFEQLMADVVGAARPPDEHYFQRLNALQERMYQQLDQFRDGALKDEGEALVSAIAALRSGAPALVPAAPAEAGRPEPVASDAELQEMFLAEAEEILQTMDREADAWERVPLSDTHLRELRRAAHTLKGSSRMAGIGGLDQVSQRLETLLEGVASGEVAADAGLFARLHNATDGLYRMLEDIKRGAVPDARPVLAELEAEAAPPEPATETLPLVTEPVPTAEIVPPAAIAPAAPAAEKPVEVEEEAHGFDPEMAEVFAGEAAELLEQIDTGLGAWQTDPNSRDAMRDIQRALHTLKGGARMGGLLAMGSAAHDMETHVDAIESGRFPADATAFARLRLELEMLQRMHDALRRGEGEKLAEAGFQPPVPEVSLAASEPAPELAQVEPAAASVAGLWDPRLFWRPEEERIGLAALRRETARVPVEHLEAMLNQAGEISIYRSRLEQHSSALNRSLAEMDQTIARVRDQLRGLNIETDAQIAARGFTTGASPDRYGGQFDPLEMDRYSRMQELSRAIAESVADLHSLHESMADVLSESETLLLQQSRISTDVQQGLMGTLMVPFSRQVQRLQRLVRQVAQEHGKLAEVQFSGVEAELDRNVLERMTAPLEHLLRNAIVHGIEAPDLRRERGKPEAGEIRVQLAREGTRLMMELADDGGGLDFEAIRKVAIERGMLAVDAEVSDEDLAQFIFQPGFTTARELTQHAGRGVGMDVVASEVRQLGGTLELRSQAGKGMRMIIRLPLTLAISQALLVSVGQEMYAIPLPSIEGIARIPKARLLEHYAEGGPPLAYGNQNYQVRYLGDYLGLPRHDVTERSVPAILVRVAEGLGAQERHVAVVVDTLHGNREIVSKSAGSQVSSITGLSGATILPDGRVVLILDVPTLVQERGRRAVIGVAQRAAVEARELILVVDDSITIRRVTERLLAKNGYRVATAKDGLDAMAWLQTESPAAILLDIEMPRADGFEVAAFVRNNERTRAVPIIMITSRSGEKHRERARNLGVDRYVIKPYQEEQLMSEIRSVLVRH
jgi:chemosensory pili system protein ChpA (sensor histidine kinase/response regulator)